VWSWQNYPPPEDESTRFDGMYLAKGWEQNKEESTFGYKKIIKRGGSESF
jgi:hypothetical protein